MDQRRRRITISDIAEQAGVSIAGVSYALNGRRGVSDDTRQRVLRVAAELGWSPTSAARSLAGADTETIGLVLARDPRLLGTESYFMQFVAGVETVLADRGYGLLLQVVTTNDDDVATMNKWRASRRVDGVLLVDLLEEDGRIELSTREGALPAVVVADRSIAGPLASVWTDDASSMRDAVDYLAGLGHTGIVRVTGFEGFAYTSIRDAAFVEAMSSRGLTPAILRTDYTPDAGAQVTRQALAGASPPSALIFDNDVMAVAALGIAAEMGLRVPDDLSVIAWDDSPLCEYVYPKLTAVGHDVMALGAHAASRLLEVIAGAPPASHQDATPRLRVRASTGPAPIRRAIGTADREPYTNGPRA